MFLKKYKKIFSSILIASIFFFYGSSFSPKETEAWWGFGDTVVEVGENLFTNIETTVLENLQWIKDNILDGIAWMAINNIIEQVSDSVVDWINNGFEGGPGFITNFDGFLEDVADQTLGDFIDGSPLAFLCSPFSLDIKIALTLQLGSEREARCTLSSAFENVNSAIDDLGNNWSWNKFSVLTQPQNNAYGAYAAGYIDLNLKMAEAEDKKIIKGNWGGGMLEFESCEKDTTKDECRQVELLGAGTTEVCTPVKVPGKCTTKTPGSLIEDTLADTLTSGNKRLQVADEINEIVGALLNQLLNSVLGSGGLLNSDPGGANGENFSELPAKTIQSLIDDVISPAIVLEEEYKSWKEQSLASVESAIAYVNAEISCWKGYVVNTSATPPTLTQDQVDAKIAAAELILTGTLNPLWARLDAEVTVAEDNITTLGLLLDRIAAAIAANPETTGANPATIQEIIDDFNALELHGKEDVATAELEYNGTIKPAMDAIIADVLTEGALCEDGGGDFQEPIGIYTPPETTGPTCTLEATLTNISPGGSSTLKWTSTGATSGTINDITVPTGDLISWTTTVTPTATTAYTGTVVGAEGTKNCGPVTITVGTTTGDTGILQFNSYIDDYGIASNYQESYTWYVTSDVHESFEIKGATYTEPLPVGAYSVKKITYNGQEILWGTDPQTMAASYPAIGVPPSLDPIYVTAGGTDYYGIRCKAESYNGPFTIYRTSHN